MYLFNPKHIISLNLAHSQFSYTRFSIAYQFHVPVHITRAPCAISHYITIQYYCECSWSGRIALNRILCIVTLMVYVCVCVSVHRRTGCYCNVDVAAAAQWICVPYPATKLTRSALRTSTSRSDNTARAHATTPQSF